MANQYFRQFPGYKEPGAVELFARITFGASGAPTLVASQSKGVSSVTRNSTGNYTLVLNDKYVSLLMLGYMWDESANGPGTFPLAPFVTIEAYSVGATGGGSITFRTGNLAAGAVADPASTEAVFLRITLKNSTAY